MMRLTYAGGSLLTGRKIASAVLTFAAALAHAERATQLEVPGRTEDGVEGTFLVLIGPASQILVEPTDDPEEIEDTAFVAGLNERIRELSSPRRALPLEEPTYGIDTEYD